MGNHRVSVIIPTYNSEKTIQRAVNSVLDSGIHDLEVIIIDDCSSDMTVHICKNIIDKRLNVLKNEQNQGVSYTRNKGLEMAKGSYLAFLDSDDYWYKDKLKYQLEILINSPPKIVGCYTHIMINGNQIRDAPDIVDFESLIYNGNDIALSSSIVKKEAVGAHVFMNVGHEDYKFWLDVLAGGGYLKCSSFENDVKSMTFYQKAHGSLSSNKFKAAIWTYKVLRSVLPLQIAIYCFCRYVLKHIKRAIC